MNDKAASRLDPQSKLHLHPQLGQYTNGNDINPINIEISPSGICQASCAFCFYANTGELGSHRKVTLDWDVLRRVLGDAVQMGVKSISWTGGGEPSLYPQIREAVEWVSSLGMEQGIFTNALSAPKYDPRFMRWVRVTMTDKPYREDIIRELRACPTLGFAFNYSGPRDDDYLITTLELAERVGADYVQLRPALAFHGQTVDIEPPKINHPLLHVTDYKFSEAKKPHGYLRCEGYHFVPFIWEDGNVDTCSYMRKHEGYTLGNVYATRLREIMSRAKPSVPVSSACQVCCRNHEINKAIQSARKLDDRNFP